MRFRERGAPTLPAWMSGLDADFLDILSYLNTNRLAIFYKHPKQEFLTNMSVFCPVPCPLIRTSRRPEKGPLANPKTSHLLAEHHKVTQIALD